MAECRRRFKKIKIKKERGRKRILNGWLVVPGQECDPVELEVRSEMVYVSRGSRGGLVNESTCPLLKLVAALSVWNTISVCVLLLPSFSSSSSSSLSVYLTAKAPYGNKGTVQDQRYHARVVEYIRP